MDRPRTALVLSGGGARGAYEVGVVQGIMDVLGPQTRSPFDVFTGTSVGAINTAYLASQAHRPDLGLPRLTALWEGLTLLRDLQIDLFGLLGKTQPEWVRRKLMGKRLPRRTGGSAMLRSNALDKIIRTDIDWDQLHANIDSGLVKACVVAALRMETGQTTVFAEMSPDAEFIPSQDPRRIAIKEPLTADHVLASASIPFIFPPRIIKGRRYVDGGLRFNTPIAPALRSGTERLVVVSVRYQSEERHERELETTERATLPFLIGKMLNAIMLDPIDYDLHVLERFNVLMDILETTVPKGRMKQVNKAITEIRGQPYRKVRTLIFHPSENIGHMATEHIRSGGLVMGDGLDAALKARLMGKLISPKSDLGSFSLFDGAFAHKLIELGRRDALDRSTAIRAFFGVL